MSFFANVKDGQDYSPIYINNKETLLVWFTQCFVDDSHDDFLYFYGATKMSPGVISSSTKEGLPPGSLVTLKVPKKEYEKNAKDANGNWVKEKVIPNAADLKVITQVADESLGGKVVNCMFNYDGRPDYVGNSGLEGTEVLAETLEEWMSNEKNLLKPLPDVTAQKKGGWGGSKGQSEKEKLAERKAFFIAELGDLVPECETVGDVWAFLNGGDVDKEQSIVIKNAMNTISLFFH